eukprot:2884458-Alexandrium_andersonii.AAC.1
MWPNSRDCEVLKRRLQDEAHARPPSAHGACCKPHHSRAITCNGDPTPFIGCKETAEPDHCRPARPSFGLDWEAEPGD